MSQSSSGHSTAFQQAVFDRFGLVPNFFQSAAEVPETVERLWDLATGLYLYGPIPSLFKERLFVYLSRFCEFRYCLTRHYGFLIGRGHSSGDPSVQAESVTQLIRLLKKPSPWQRDLNAVLRTLESISTPIDWPEPETDLENFLFATATVVLVARHKRNSRMSPRVAMMGELTASIAHEVLQPLAGVTTYADAGLRWLAGSSPDHDELRACLDRTSRDVERAGEVIARIRALVKKPALTKAWLDLNEAIQEALAMVEFEAADHEISVRTGSAAGLPSVQGDRVQLHQVVLNLVMNGIDTSKVVTGRPRTLLITSRPHESEDVLAEAHDRALPQRGPSYTLYASCGHRANERGSAAPDDCDIEGLSGIYRASRHFTRPAGRAALARSSRISRTVRPAPRPLAEPQAAPGSVPNVNGPAEFLFART